MFEHSRDQYDDLFKQTQHGTGEHAQGDRSERAHQDGQSGQALRLDHHGFLTGLSEEHDAHEAEVVERRDRRGDEAHDRKPADAALDRVRENHELSNETTSQRDAREGQQEHQHRAGDPRVRAPDARPLRQAPPLAPALAGDCKC